METDPQKLREVRLNQPHMSSEQARLQFETVQMEASRYAEMAKRERFESGRVRED